MQHPAILQIRGKIDENKEEVLLKLTEKLSEEFEVERSKDGLNIYLPDVNTARAIISKIRKQFKVDIKMSTKYAGLRRGRVRVLFVYCLRFQS